MSASNLPNSYAYKYEFHSIAKPNLIVRCIPRDVLDVKKTKTIKRQCVTTANLET